MDDAVIIGGVRTPIGTLGGSLAGISAIRLGAITIAEALNRSLVPSTDVDEVLMGNVISAGLGENPARQASMLAALPHTIPSTTVNKVCGSGLQTVVMASQAVRLGDAAVVVAGGMENMSRGPYLLPNGRFGYRLGHGELIDAVVNDGLWCNLAECHMGVTAENVAERWNISRERMDEFSYNSNMRAARAWNDGTFSHEVIPVNIPQRRGDPKIVERDEHFRPDTTIEQLGKLRPAFKAQGGTVTAGNSSGVNDGAAAVVVTSSREAQRRHAEPIAIIRGYASVGVEPDVMGIAPVGAIQKALDHCGLQVQDIDLFELNEAFAAQSLAVIKELDLDLNKVNVNGGAVALGHPLGCSGTRILVTLLYEMGRRGSKLGVAALCIGGGMGIAVVVENPKA